MTYTERQSCICTLNTLRRLALNIHGVIDVVDDVNCNKLIELLNDDSKTLPSVDRVLEIINGCKFSDDTELDPYDGIMWHNRALEQAKQAVLALKEGEA